MAAAPQPVSALRIQRGGGGISQGSGERASVKDVVRGAGPCEHRGGGHQSRKWFGGVSQGSGVKVL
jgi:hypothetical protein